VIEKYNIRSDHVSANYAKIVELKMVSARHCWTKQNHGYE